MDQPTTIVTAPPQTEASLSRQAGRKAAAAQLSQVALSGLDVAALFDQATQAIAESLDVDYCKILQLRPDGQMILRAGFGWQPGLVDAAMVGSGCDSQAGYTLLLQNPVVVDDLRVEDRFTGSALLTDHGIVSGMSTVIQGRDGAPFGVLGAHAARLRKFSQNDVNFLQTVANVLAAAIARKQSEEELHQLNLTLEQRVRERTQALEAVNKELDAFSYSVAHDLRAPLRSIKGFSQVLVADYGTLLDDLGKEYIRRMATSAETLDALVQDLLAYSRLGRSEIHLQRVSINVVVKNVLAALASIPEVKQASIEIQTDLPTVYAQRTIIEQVLNNLIRNAATFVAPDRLPQICIWASGSESRDASGTERPHVRIWVGDNGIGIAPRHQARIFEPFERLHGKEAYAGTGIGLSIVKRGMQRMGGRVGVESAVDEGSRFWIELQQAVD